MKERYQIPKEYADAWDELVLNDRQDIFYFWQIADAFTKSPITDILDFARKEYWESEVFAECREACYYDPALHNLMLRHEQSFQSLWANPGETFTNRELLLLRSRNQFHDFALIQLHSIQKRLSENLNANHKLAPLILNSVEFRQIIDYYIGCEAKYFLSQKGNLFAPFKKYIYLKNEYLKDIRKKAEHDLNVMREYDIFIPSRCRTNYSLDHMGLLYKLHEHFAKYIKDSAQYEGLNFASPVPETMIFTEPARKSQQTNPFPAYLQNVYKKLFLFTLPDISSGFVLHPLLSAFRTSHDTYESILSTFLTPVAAGVFHDMLEKAARKFADDIPCSLVDCLNACSKEHDAGKIVKCVSCDTLFFRPAEKHKLKYCTRCLSNTDGSAVRPKDYHIAEADSPYLGALTLRLQHAEREAERTCAGIAKEARQQDFNTRNPDSSRLITSRQLLHQMLLRTKASVQKQGILRLFQECMTPYLKGLNITTRAALLNLPTEISQEIFFKAYDDLYKTYMNTEEQQHGFHADIHLLEKYLLLTFFHKKSKQLRRHKNQPLALSDEEHINWLSFLRGQLAYQKQEVFLLCTPDQLKGHFFGHYQNLYYYKKGSSKGPAEKTLLSPADLFNDPDIRKIIFEGAFQAPQSKGIPSR